MVKNIVKGKTSATPVVYASGRKIVQKSFEGKFTRSQIENHAQKLSNKLQQQLGADAGRISVAINYPSIGWRSGMFKQFGDNIRLHDYTYEDDLEEPDYFDGFVAYFEQTPGRRGGKGRHNDCLYDALKIILQDKMPWKYPSKLKKFLGIGRDDLVSVDHMPMIENKLKNYKISVRGDYTYTSTMNARLEVNLKLINEHYTIDNKAKLMRDVFHGTFKEKKNVLFVRRLETNEVETYNGTEYKMLSSSEFYNLRKELIKDWLICYSDINTPTKDYKLEHEYADFVKNAKILKKESKGLLNMWIFGNKASTLAMSLFDKFTKTIPAEPIEQDEAEWIEQSNSGSLVWVEKEYKGEVYEYDFNSFYPSSMANERSKYPIKRGEFKKLSQEEFEQSKYFKYGIYRAVVTNPNGIKDVSKLFRFNKSNYYTYIDLTVAKNLNLNIQLIQDTQPNALIYSNDCLISGRQLFGKYVDVVYELKKNNVPLSKMILNVLWGVLSYKRTIRLTTTALKNDDNLIIEEGKSIVEIRPCNKGDTEVKIVEHTHLYKTCFARIKPFILARGRERIGTAMKPHLDNIIRCHTDGFHSLVKLDIETGKELGKLQLKGKLPVHIKMNYRIDRGNFI